jgi:hypothetical protein
MSAKAVYEEVAAVWDAVGRSDALLISGWKLLGLRCWCHSPGGKREGVSPTLADFLAASVQGESTDWVEDLLGDRESCRRCGEVYRVENLQLCTACMDTTCYRCASVGPLAANGNPACPCGGELVG